MSLEDHNIDGTELSMMMDAFEPLQEKVDRLHSALSLLLSAFSDRMHPDVVERIREELRDPPTSEDMD